MNPIVKRTAEIVLHLQNAEQLLVSPDSLFYRKRMLSADAEELIIEEAEINHYHTVTHLKILMSDTEVTRAVEISTAIHQHFSYRKKKSQVQLKNILSRGWRSLLIGLVSFSALVIFVTNIDKLSSEAGFLITVRETFIILGWVALWRPAELLLYEWRPFKREARLFGSLEHCKVEIVPAP